MHRPEAVLRVLASLSRNIATAAAVTTLSEDIAGDGTPSRAAVAQYLEALRRVFVVVVGPVRRSGWCRLGQRRRGRVGSKARVRNDAIWARVTAR